MDIATEGHVRLCCNKIHRRGMKGSIKFPKQNQDIYPLIATSGTRWLLITKKTSNHTTAAVTLPPSFKLIALSPHQDQLLNHVGGGRDFHLSIHLPSASQKTMLSLKNQAEWLFLIILASLCTTVLKEIALLKGIQLKYYFVFISICSEQLDSETRRSNSAQMSQATHTQVPLFSGRV